jgi:hypothetical protein
MHGQYNKIVNDTGNTKMEGTIAGSISYKINMDSTIAGSMNGKINMNSVINSPLYCTLYAYVVMH